jgi:hypothetical protein
METTVDVTWLAVVVGVIIPALVALIKRRYASSALGAWLLLLLSAVGGTVTQIIGNNGSFVVKDALAATAVAFVTAVAAHYGFLKPVNVTGNDGVIMQAIPSGIGKTDTTLAA